MYGSSTVLTPLIRRWRRSAPLRRRLLTGVVALGGVLLIAVPPQSQRIWHDVGLSVLVFAVTLPVWRAPEEGLPVALRLRELHRRICRRCSTGLVLSGTLALIADRWLTARHTAGDAADARSIAVWGIVLACLGAVPLAAERLLWRLWPAQLRKAAKVAEVVDSISQKLYSVGRSGPAPNLEPVLVQPAGPPSAAACVTPVPRSRRPRRSELRWDGHHLIVHSPQGDTYPVPVAGRAGDGALPHAPRGLRPVSRMVWCRHAAIRASGVSGVSGVSGKTLLLLDDAGYRCGVVTDLYCSQNDAARVARAAGVAFTVYDLGFAGYWFEELMTALFPRKGKVFVVSG